MAAEADKYRLSVSAGPGYHPETHTDVLVNANKTMVIENEHMTVQLCTRIQDYTGLPEGSPATNPYFSHPLHRNDQYSISFSFVPKHPIPGDELVFGNDFDRPIRDRLPTGFNAALRFVKWMIDPGLEGDAYADKPYLYGPALSSWNYFNIGMKEGQDANGLLDTDNPNPCMAVDFYNEVVEEGGEGSGEAVREELNIPDTPHQRKKWFLDEHNLQEFVFEEGRLYKADFGNPYLVFNDFSLCLPGFTLNVLKYVDEKNHELRYVLKNKRTGDVYFVILFTLVHVPPSNSKENSPVTSRPSTGDDNVGEPHSRFDHELAPCTDDVD